MLSHAALAELAGRSYIGPWSGRAALDCEYDLLPREGELIVVMPGTNPADPLDWIRDMSVAPCWLEGVGPVHEGFGRGGEALFARIARTVKGDPRPLTIIGHSLGGALGQIVAALIAARLPSTAFGLVTFGAPRAGFLNPWFARLVRSGVHAVEYRRRGDIVPDLPSAPPFNHPTSPRNIGTPVALTPGLDEVGRLERAICDNHASAAYAADLAALKL